jgi:hypothetical protein
MHPNEFESAKDHLKPASPEEENHNESLQQQEACPCTSTPTFNFDRKNDKEASEG